MMKETVAFIGGDRRQLYAADSMKKIADKIYLVGFEKAPDTDDLIKTDLVTAVNIADVFIFPVTGIKGKTVPSQYSDKEIKLSDDLLQQLKSKMIFCGKSGTLQNLCSELRIYDYLRREEFAVANALPTAEGALQIAMENYPGTIFNSSCLVIGYGRIGKILSKTLKALNAKVTVSARKKDHFRYIQSDGNNCISTNEIDSLEPYDIVFNTVEKLLIDKKMLANTNSETLIIDLASAPGGVDFASAESLGIKAVQALSLPGKCAPKTAGEIIAETITDIIKEEYRWQKLI